MVKNNIRCFTIVLSLLGASDISTSQKQQVTLMDRVEMLPRVLSAYIGSFLHCTISPAPALDLVYSGLPDYEGQRLSLLGVTNKGDIVCGSFDHNKHQVVTYKRFEQFKPHVTIFENGWELLRSPDKIPSWHGIVPVVRIASKATREHDTLGAFFIEDGSIREIGIYKPGDRVGAINWKSAVVFPVDEDREKTACWIVNGQRSPLAELHNNSSVYQSISLDVASNVLTWERYLGGCTWVKNLDTQYLPYRLVMETEETVDSCCHRNGSIMGSIDGRHEFHGVLYLVHEQNTLLFCSIKPVVLPGADQTRVLGKMIALNHDNSKMLCKFTIDPWQKKRILYPGVICLQSGAVAYNECSSINKCNPIIGCYPSDNGLWMAGWDAKGQVFLWEAKGFNLDEHYTLEDRLMLRELAEFYRIGQERNIKYDRNYVIRLNEEQYAAFERFIKRNVPLPSNWRRLFRKMKPLKNAEMILPVEELEALNVQEYAKLRKLLNNPFLPSVELADAVCAGKVQALFNQVRCMFDEQ